VTNVALPASPITISVPASTNAGTYTGTITVTNANGCVSNGTTFTVTVNPLPTITTAATATSVCYSTLVQTTPLTYSATTGAPTTYSITWNPAPANSFGSSDECSPAGKSDNNIGTGQHKCRNLYGNNYSKECQRMCEQWDNIHSDSECPADNKPRQQQPQVSVTVLLHRQLR